MACKNPIIPGFYPDPSICRDLVTTYLEFDPQEENEEAGLTLPMTNEHHYQMQFHRGFPTI